MVIFVAVSACSTTAPLPLSRTAGVHANFNERGERDGASDATDGDGDTSWGSYGSSLPDTPVELTLELSRSAARKVGVVVSWRDASWAFDSRLGVDGANAGVDWSLELATRERGPWAVKARVTGDTQRSRLHVLELGGDERWLRLRVTSAGSSAFVKVNVDVFDARAASPGWLLIGDSISAYVVRDDSLGGVGTPVPGLKSISQYVNDARPPLFPIVLGGGFPGWTTGDFLEGLGPILARFPGKYVCVALGTNDAGHGLVRPGTSIANYRDIARQILAAGKTPCFPRVPWTPRVDLQSDVSLLNTQLDALALELTPFVRGPDFFELLRATPALLRDELHPNDEGIRAMRLAWAETIARTEMKARGESH